MMPETGDSWQGVPLRMLPPLRDEQVKKVLKTLEKNGYVWHVLHTKQICFLWQTEKSGMKFRQCAEAKIYGTAVCIEAEAKRAHYLHEYPLYYLLGDTRFSYNLEPGTRNFNSLLTGSKT